MIKTDKVSTLSLKALFSDEERRAVIEITNDPNPTYTEAEATEAGNDLAQFILGTVPSAVAIAASNIIAGKVSALRLARASFMSSALIALAKNPEDIEINEFMAEQKAVEKEAVLSAGDLSDFYDRFRDFVLMTQVRDDVEAFFEAVEK